MARYRHHLPVGLPPTLTSRILMPPGRGRGGPVPYGYEPGLGALGFSFKKAFKAVAKTVTKAAQIATAPMKLAIEAPLKAVTWTAAQTGIKPLVKLDSAVRSDLKTTIKDTKTAAVIGAGVGIGIVTGGTTLPALIPTMATAGSQLLAASKPKPKPGAPAPAAAPPPTEVAAQPGIDPATGKPLALPKVMQAGMLPGGLSPIMLIGGAMALGLVAVLLFPSRRIGEKAP